MSKPADSLEALLTIVLMPKSVDSIGTLIVMISKMTGSLCALSSIVLTTSALSFDPSGALPGIVLTMPKSVDLPGVLQSIALLTSQHVTGVDERDLPEADALTDLDAQAELQLFLEAQAEKNRDTVDDAPEELVLPTAVKIALLKADDAYDEGDVPAPGG